MFEGCHVGNYLKLFSIDFNRLQSISNDFKPVKQISELLLKKKYDIALDELKDLLSDREGYVPSAEEINETEEALLRYAKAHAKAPPATLRNKILGKITALQARSANHQKLDLGNLPMLDETSSWPDWEEAVQGIEPPGEFENIHLHSLESSEKRDLFVAWVKQEVPEEVHHDILESFLILEGSCECHITDEKGSTRIVRMGQGDFITMQVGETHDIVITSLKPVKAILQWRKIAA